MHRCFYPWTTPYYNTTMDEKKETINFVYYSYYNNIKTFIHDEVTFPELYSGHAGQC